LTRSSASAHAPGRDDTHDAYKEVRALSLAWFACIFVMILPALVSSPRHAAGIQLIAYFYGAAVLGALSIGREYVGRTLNQLLSVPVRRDRLLLVKLGVLAVMLLALGVVAYTHLFNAFPVNRQTDRLAVSLLPVLGGLFIAPWLTMACRSPVAGTALTVAIPFVLVMLGREIAFRLGTRVDAFMMTFLWRGTLGTCAIGAVATWRAFMRLEATGCVEDLPLPQWPRLRTRTLRRISGRREPESNGARSAAVSLSRRHAIWQLVAKELRVQQPALFITGLYLFGWLVVTLRVADGALDLNAALSAFYVLLLAVLAGSLGSVEERQMGTIEWQVLQPMAMWRQWIVKIGVALGLAALLGIGLPALLAHFAPATGGRSFVGPGLPIAVAVLLVTAGGLYVSSLCGTGAVALAMSLPVAFGAFWFQTVALGRVGYAAHGVWSRVFDVAAASGVRLRGPDLVHALDLVLIAGFIAMLARFALTNHRYADRSPWRVCKQAILMAAFAAVRVVILSGAVALSGGR